MTNKEIGEYRRNFINKFYLEKGMGFCMETLGIKEDAFHLHRKKINLPIREDERGATLARMQRNKDASYKFPVDKILNPDSGQVAYLLGLGWGDGSINKNTFLISILSSDMENILPFFDDFAKFNVRKYSPKGGKEQTSISIINKTIADFLKVNKYNDKKSSPDSIIELIPNKFKYLFFRGFLDADGCIFYKKYGNRDRCKVTFSSCYAQNWTFLESLLGDLDVKFNIVRVYGRKNFPNRSYSSLEIPGFESQIKFLNYIYSDYNTYPIGLKRKYQKALEISRVYKTKSQFNQIVTF